MREEFKSLAYGIIHNSIFAKAMIGIVIVVLIISGAPVMLNGGELTMEDTYSGMLMLMANGALLFVMGAAAYMFCDDFGDKTLYYEILIGKKRRQVYLARTAVTLSVVLTGYVCMVLSIALSVSIWGFGSAESVKWLFVRLLMIGLEYMRTAAFLIFACQIGKVFISSYSIGSVIFAPLILSMIKGKETPYLLTSLAVNNLAIPGTQVKYNIAVGGIKQFVRYDWSLSGNIIAEVIITSVLFTALYLFLGWLFFKKDDLP